MTKLNRFPLLALWAKTAAEVQGYTENESKILGHAYAVLYAIRANFGRGYVKSKNNKRKKKYTIATTDDVLFDKILFCGDHIDVEFDATHTIIKGLVGGGKPPQTPESYKRAVMMKFPGDYYNIIYKRFFLALSSFKPEELKGRLVYNLYDRWKKECAHGRFVDLDKLINWLDNFIKERVNEISVSDVSSERDKIASNAG